MTQPLSAARAVPNLGFKHFQVSHKEQENKRTTCERGEKKNRKFRCVIVTAYFAYTILI